MTTTEKSPTAVEMVTVTREQFNAMRVAVLHHVFECRDQARECTRIGSKELAAKWFSDANRSMSLYNELAGL